MFIASPRRSKEIGRTRVDGWRRIVYGGGGDERQALGTEVVLRRKEARWEKKGQKRGKREGAEVATRSIRACRKTVPSVQFVQPLKLVRDI